MAKRRDPGPTAPVPRRVPRQAREGDRVFNWTRYVPGSSGGDLSREIETYARNIRKLAPREGDYVLIKGDSICSTFKTREQAAGEAFRQFGDQPVLIKQILRLQPIADIPGVDL